MARRILDPKVKKIVQDYLTLLGNDKLPMDGVFVFGSRLTKQFRRDSDIDVAVISPRFRDPLASNKYLLQKAHELPEGTYYIEPHAFHPKNFINENPITWEIKQTGIRVY